MFVTRIEINPSDFILQTKVRSRRQFAPTPSHEANPTSEDPPPAQVFLCGNFNAVRNTTRPFGLSPVILG